LLLEMPTASRLVPQPHVLHEPEVQEALLALRRQAALLLRKPVNHSVHQQKILEGWVAKVHKIIKRKNGK
jgi:hypothetical protein